MTTTYAFNDNTTWTPEGYELNQAKADNRAAKRQWWNAWIDVYESLVGFVDSLGCSCLCGTTSDDFASIRRENFFQQKVALASMYSVNSLHGESEFGTALRRAWEDERIDLADMEVREIARELPPEDDEPGLPQLVAVNERRYGGDWGTPLQFKQRSATFVSQMAQVIQLRCYGMEDSSVNRLTAARMFRNLVEEGRREGYNVRTTDVNHHLEFVVDEVFRAKPTHFDRDNYRRAHPWVLKAMGFNPAVQRPTLT